MCIEAHLQGSSPESNKSTIEFVTPLKNNLVGVHTPHIRISSGGAILSRTIVGLQKDTVLFRKRKCLFLGELIPAPKPFYQCESIRLPNQASSSTIIILFLNWCEFILFVN